MHLRAFLKELVTPVRVRSYLLEASRGLCPICDEVHSGGEAPFCENCLAQLDFTYSWYDPFFCKNEGMAIFEHVLPLCYYGGGLIRPSIFQFKYHGQFSIGEAYGHLLGRFLLEGGYAQVFDAIVPVPIHWRKLLIRGYNQTALLAAALADELAIPVVPALRRVRHRRSQTRVKTRSSNVQGVFQLAPDAAERYAGQHLLLIDDVLTSGSTSLVCASCLRNIPDVRLSFASLAVRRSMRKRPKRDFLVEEI